jgi:lysine-specific demethylase 8
MPRMGGAVATPLAAATARLTTRPIEHIDPPSPARFQADYVRPRRPVVLRGLGEEWPARSWTLEHLERDFAGVSVPVLPTRSGRVVVDPQHGLVRHTIPFGEYAAAVRSGDSVECLTARADELPADFEHALPPPVYSRDAPWQVMKCWLLPTGTVSDLHFDLADNLHTVIFGTKRFTLVHPRESSCVYPNRLVDSIPNGCQVDIEQPDFERFPRLAGVHLLIAELEPGDTLYIPRRWWHHGRTVALALSVNHWWARGPWSGVVKAADLFKRARGISR